jgi:predicted ATPase
VAQEESERQWLLQRLAPLVGVEAASPGERQELFTAWRRFLEGLAAGRPTVLVFEDLHWADEALLAFLEHLAEWAEGVPLLVLCTARPELYEQHPRWAGATRNATTINLSPLTDAETAQLVSALLTQTGLTDELERAIVERAGGNPLYAEEFVRLLRDRGLALGAGNGEAAIAFPDNVQALIAARLDTLAPERKSLLQDAAVLGKVFWAGALSEMGARDPQEVEQALHELSRKELIRSARTSSMEGEAEYAFWHALVRDVAYAQIPRAERARRHRAAAGWLEAKAGERVEDLAELLAHHYLAALELAQAAGEAEEAASLMASARQFLQLAGERALGLDTAHAEALLAQALTLAPPGDPERPRVLAAWAGAARQAARHSEAAHALREAIETFRRQGETLAAAQTTMTLAAVLWPPSCSPNWRRCQTPAPRVTTPGGSQRWSARPSPRAMSPSRSGS